MFVTSISLEFSLPSSPYADVCLLWWCVSGEQERVAPAPPSTHVCLLVGGIGIINIQSYYWKVCVHSCHFVGFIVFGFPHFLSWLVIILMWFSIFHDLPPSPPICIAGHYHTQHVVSFDLKEFFFLWVFSKIFISIPLSKDRLEFNLSFWPSYTRLLNLCSMLFNFNHFLH